VLHDPRAGGGTRVPVHAAGALLQPRSDGLRHGKLQIIDHDGHGNLRFDERPFVIMQDGAFVDLGRVEATGPLAVAPRR